ncbi:MAG TPA: Asp-tRNA(Asn)/Glu-tRNA(Gln) amidotransferase subunit GatC [Candidatus Methylomirabilis sp.]|nr:Asp-tRNA(Asn)/Glu-tRNA(Gln) amidotransferase subunit GatC [Candidatus Methylomirabilis sp.]
MKITLQEVEHVARLARLALSGEEKEQMRSQLDRILGHIEKLNQLDTAEVEPTSHVIPMTNVFRDDALIPSLSREEALENAPDRQEEFFRVPRIIEQ